MQTQVRVFSGIQPSGRLTIGNYLGAMKQFVALQDQGKVHNLQTVFCLVDLHAITVWQDPRELRQAIYELTAGFIATGINTEHSILFQQSAVSAHANLGWIFNCVARMGWLNRMTQFKDKAGKNREHVSVGLFGYPTLMAADILLYHATEVPVGEDQKQHIELARDIAIKFNHDYGVDFFPIPEPKIQGVATRIMSLRDGTKKMSKSDPSDFSRINLVDDNDLIAQKIRKAKSDPDALPSDTKGLQGRPEATNLVNIYAAFTEKTPQAVLDVHGGHSFSVFKAVLSEVIIGELSPIREKMEFLLQDRSILDKTLYQGKTKAKAIADPIYEQVKRLCGLA